jgi:N-acetylmuramoyl-L-alanine amidase
MLGFLLITSGWGIDFHDFDSYQKKFTQKEVERRIALHLEKDSEIGLFYRIEDGALKIGDLTNGEIDYVLRFAPDWSQREHFRARGSLREAKIAIDPGHFGGVFAELEERVILIPGEKTRDGQPIRFDEGTLTYQTALVLKELLEKEGTQVMLTRRSIGQGAIEEGFFDWLQKHPSLWTQKDSLSKLFRTHYNRADMRKRAEVINQWAPDLTVIIHFNAHLSDDEEKRKEMFTKTNFNLVFVPGAFCSGELNHAESRYEFLRLLLTSDIDQSIALSEKVLGQLEKHLNVPRISSEEKTSYKESGCLFQRPGIYARNLALTRLIHGPLCYGESLIQNNEEELYRLAAQDCEVAGSPCSKRVSQVAQAYFEGIRDYFEEGE